MKINIKIANKKCIEEIANLMLAEFKKFPYNETVKINAVLKSLDFYFKIGKIYVAIEKNKIVGCLVFKIEQYWQGKVIIIEDLAVKQEFKRFGIGKSLLNELENYANKNEMFMICFNTNRKSPAIKFYRKYGYKQRRDITHFERKL